MTTHTIAIIDASGSMSDYRDDTIGGFNSFIDTLAAETEQDHKVSAVKFANPDYYEALCTDAVPGDDIKLNQTNYRTMGMTALYDAVGRTITDFDKLNCVNEGDNVILAVITDGAENASNDWSNTTVKALLEAKEAAGWKIVYLATGFDGWNQAKQMGIKTNSYGGTMTMAPESLRSGYNTLGKFSTRTAAGQPVHSTREVLLEDLPESEVQPPAA